MNETTPVTTPTARSKLAAEYVYIDASTYKQLQFDWTGRDLSGLLDLAQCNLIQVLVTNITRREVTALMNDACKEAFDAADRRKVLLRNLGLASTLETLIDIDACVRKMNQQFDKWLRAGRAVSVDDPPDLPTVIDDYFSGRPPFEVGKKKAEFPDALVVSSLRVWAAKRKKRAIYVASADPDLANCCDVQGLFIHAKSIREIVSHGKASADIHRAILTHLQESVSFVRLFQSLVESAQIEVEGGHLGYARGYQQGSQVDIEMEDVRMEGMFISDLYVEALNEDLASCAIYVDCELELGVHVSIDPLELDEESTRHKQSFNVNEDISATVVVKLGFESEAAMVKEVTDCWLESRRISVPWSRIESCIKVW